MKVAPYLIFFPLSALFFVGLFQGWNLWFATGFMNTVLVGFLWTVLPQLLGQSGVRVQDLFPVGMLVLFSFVLCETQGRMNSEALFYTACALISFRTLFILMRLVSGTLQKIEVGVGIWCVGLVVQMGCDLYRVYHSFRPSSIDGVAEPMWLKWISIRFLLLCLALGWGWSNRKGAKALLPGAIFIFWGQKLEWAILLFGFGFMVELWLYQQHNKNKLS